MCARGTRWTRRAGRAGRSRRTWPRTWLRRAGADTGMTTAEYALGTVAACAFAAVLYRVVTSGSVAAALEGLIGRALDAQF